MKKCADCGYPLERIDFIGTFFTPVLQGWLSWPFWFLPRLILSLIGVALINKFTTDEISGYLVALYMTLVLIGLTIRFKKHLNDFVYECVNCKRRYKGIKREPFNYGASK